MKNQDFDGSTMYKQVALPNLFMSKIDAASSIRQRVPKWQIQSKYNCLWTCLQSTDSLALTLYIYSIKNQTQSSNLAVLVSVWDNRNVGLVWFDLAPIAQAH